MNRLNEIISFNNEFKNAINLYLNLNKRDKVNSYIPTKSSISILKKYIEAVEVNKAQSTLLIGPYGKGKSHLLLVLLAIISMNRNKENEALIIGLKDRIGKIDSNVAESIENIWYKKGKFLPVIIMNSQGDLNQSFLVALNDALKREGLSDLTPDTYFTYAISAIKRWKEYYEETYAEYLKLLKERNITVKKMISGLSRCDVELLNIFKEFYPKLTAGSVFNPLAEAQVLPMYKSVADKLKEKCGYSGIYIVFDEFSKFIEGQDKKAAGYNMKLLQDMCELASESKESQVHITMVAHKSIKEYGKYLSAETINSFTGIEGRLEEVLFVTSSKNNYELIQNAIFKSDEDLEKIPQKDMFFSPKAVDKFYDIAPYKMAFTVEDFERIVVRGCYPLNPVSSYILLNISEKVAQNERTLFTFISKEEPYSMANYVKEHPCSNGREWIVNSDLIYDYFKNLFKKDISNEYVHNEWLNAEYALSKVNEYNQTKLLKTLAVMSIVNKPDELPTDKKHLILAAGIPDGGTVIEQLVNKKLIYKKGSNDCYVFKTRAGSELKNEIRKRREIKGDTANIGKVLLMISDVKYVLPKQYNQTYSMTRYFRYEFMNVEEFLEISNSDTFFENEQFCDGKVIALFSLDDKNREEELKECIKNYKNEKLVIIYSHNKFDMMKQAQDYEVIHNLKNDILFFEENEVLKKEVPIFEEDLERELFKFIDSEFGDNNASKTIYCRKGKLYAEENLAIGKIIDSICLSYYNRTMIINNELINRENVPSAPIKKARKIIMGSLLNRESDEMFLTGTSAESTIYRALIVNTGIRSSEYKDNVEAIMEIYNEFLLSCGEEKKSLAILVDQLAAAPFALRRGVIPVYLALAISKRNEDIVVYYGTKEVPISTDAILNMCENPKEYSLYISMEDIVKEKYIHGLWELFEVDNNTNLSDSRINNILICMQRWYRALPQVTKNIKMQNSYLDSEVLCNSLPKIKSLLQSIDVNPYEAIFKQIPEAFGEAIDFDTCIEYILSLKTMLNGHFEYILEKSIKGTIKVFDRKAKDDLNHTLKNWYEKQSNMSKQGLHEVQITGLMSCIAEINSYDDSEIVKKVVKSVTNVYVDSWNDNSYDEFIENLIKVKRNIEAISDTEENRKCKLTFVGKEGDEVERFYDKVDESTGAIFRNIIEDTLEDFPDLNVNDKVAILLETIEKIINQR